MRLVSAPRWPAGRRSSPSPCGLPSTGTGSVPQRGRLHVLEPRTPGLNPQPPRGGAASSSLLFVVGHPISHSLSPCDERGSPGLAFLSTTSPSISPPVISAGSFRSYARGTSSADADDPLARGSRRSGGHPFQAGEDLRRREHPGGGHGKLHAENTDGAGFLDALEGGGMGTSIPPGRPPRRRRGGPRYRFCRREGGRPGRLSCWNRHPRRAEKRVARLLSGRVSRSRLCRRDSRQTCGRSSGVGTIVQCTSLGFGGSGETFEKDVQKSSGFAI